MLPFPLELSVCSLAIRVRESSVSERAAYQSSCADINSASAAALLAAGNGDHPEAVSAPATSAFAIQNASDCQQAALSTPTPSRSQHSAEPAANSAVSPTMPVVYLHPELFGSAATNAAAKTHHGPPIARGRRLLLAS